MPEPAVFTQFYPVVGHSDRPLFLFLGRSTAEFLRHSRPQICANFPGRLHLITCWHSNQLNNRSLKSRARPQVGRHSGMASRPGPSPLSDHQIQSVISRLVNLYVRNRKTISRTGWLILLVSLGNRVRVAVNDQKNPRPTTSAQAATKKRKADVRSHPILCADDRSIGRSLTDCGNYSRS